MKRTFATLIAVAGMLLFTLATGAQAQAQSADDPAQLEAGKAIFEMTCAGCHSVDGSGSDSGRSLIGIASQGERARHIASVTEGRGGMPAFGERLDEAEIDAAVTYVRLTFVEASAETTAEEAPATTELAVTGINSTGLTVIGLAMLAGGLQLVAFSRGGRGGRRE